MPRTINKINLKNNPNTKINGTNKHPSPAMITTAIKKITPTKKAFICLFLTPLIKHVPSPGYFITAEFTFAVNNIIFFHDITNPLY